MKEKNRFSGLLKHLLTVTKVKNYSLAKELQYDESYISKWVNGNLLPTEKTADKIFRDISRCITAALDDESRPVLYSEYQVDIDSDLEAAIYDNLVAEYSYVMDLKESTGSEIAQKTSFYPELTLTQFMQKMRHPILRQVKALDVIAAVDILALDKNYQMAISELKNAGNTNVTQRSYPGVHFSMLMNLDKADRNLMYNAQFLLNLLTNLSNVNFQIYVCPQAEGKIVFTVRDSYCISGMIMDENHCLAVSASEDPKNCNAIYERLQSLCSQEQLAVRRITMAEMLKNKDYVSFLFARNQRWLLGHFTEHFLPDDLFRELAVDYCQANPDVPMDILLRIRMFIRSIIENSAIEVLAYENAFNEFAVTGMVDFFNTKLYLTPEQRLRALDYTGSLYSQNPKLTFRYIRDGVLSDFRHIPDPTLFLSDNLCYLRLARTGLRNNLSIINKIPVAELFRNFFNAVWNDTACTETNVQAVEDIFRYTRQMVEVQILYQSE